MASSPRIRSTFRVESTCRHCPRGLEEEKCTASSRSGGVGWGGGREKKQHLSTALSLNVHSIDVQRPLPTSAPARVQLPIRSGFRSPPLNRQDAQPRDRERRFRPRIRGPIDCRGKKKKQERKIKHTQKCRAGREQWPGGSGGDRASGGGADEGRARGESNLHCPLEGGRACRRRARETREAKGGGGDAFQSL